VVVFRTIDGQRQAAGFDLLAIRRAQVEDPVIYPNDIVVVDGRDVRVRSALQQILNTIPILAIFRPF
jgi:polysaccharide export outer membrane protein